MRGLRLFPDNSSPRQILCLGAHCDDIEIGCGGTLLRLLNEHSMLEVTWVVFTSNKQREKEAEAGAKLFSQKAKRLQFQPYGFRDGFLPYSGSEVKETFEQIKQQIARPDLIFTHYRDDLHQDHRLVSELTWNTFRDHFILEYEIPKWDGDLGNPNAFVELSEEIGELKIDLLHQAYVSQRDKHWFSRDLFWSLMRIRGMESTSPSSIAEAFYCRKAVLNP